VLIITRIFPNAVEPLSSPFNRQQFSALGRLCDVEVMATIPWFPGASLSARSKAGSLASVPSRDVIAGLNVRHPRVVYVPRLAGMSGALEVASLLPHMASLRGKFDVILGSWAYPDGAAAVALGRLMHIPTVIKVHGSDLNVQSTMRGPRANLKFALPRAAHVVAVSRSLGDKAIELGVAKDRVSVVSNGVDASLFHVRDKAHARHQVGWSSDEGLILYCGRMERDKGVLDLIKAFTRVCPQIDGLSLALLGDGSAMQEAREMAQPLGKRVQFLGARPLAEVPLWMSAADVVTLPSHAEGSPNVVREALACGRPVVATRVGGIPELITSRDFGTLVEKGDAGALADALLDVATRTFDASSLAKASGGSWDDSAAALLGILNRAYEQAQRGPR
jgi:glycosyltransferase involved in cell wall biosynthesis